MSSITRIMLVSASMIAVILSCRTLHNQQEEAMPTKPIDEVLTKYTKKLMSMPGVVGTAQGLLNDKPCIIVLIVKKTPELSRKIPKILDGYPVVIDESGEIHALPNDQQIK